MVSLGACPHAAGFLVSKAVALLATQVAIATQVQAYRGGVGPEKGADVVLNAAKRQQHVNDSDPLQDPGQDLGQGQLDPWGLVTSCLVLSELLK